MPVKLVIHTTGGLGPTEVVFPKDKVVEELTYQPRGNTALISGKGKLVGLSDQVSYWYLEVGGQADDPSEDKKEFEVMKVDKEDISCLLYALKVMEAGSSDLGEDVMRAARSLTRELTRLKEKVE